MSNLTFNSVQSDMFKTFIEMKRAQGYVYNTQAYLLHQFDLFLCNRSYRYSWLKREIVEEYVHHFKHWTPFSQSKMLSVVRVYSRFLHLRQPQSYVVEKLPFKVKRPSRFYIYSAEEIAALMQGANELGPINSIRPYTVKTLIGRTGGVEC